MSRGGAFAVLLGIVAAIALAVLVWGNLTPSLSQSDSLYLVYMVIALTFIGSGIMSRGAGRPARMVRDLLIWAGIITVFAVGFAKVQEFRAQGHLEPGQHEPGQPISAPDDVTTVAPDTGGSATIAKSQDGHYWVDARINGRTQRVMIDTGASVVALPLADARRMGITPRADDYSISLQTANGPTLAAHVSLQDVRVAGITLHNVDAVILKDGLTTPLLGMSFLGRLKSFEAKDDTLRLRL